MYLFNSKSIAQPFFTEEQIMMNYNTLTLNSLLSLQKGFTIDLTLIDKNDSGEFIQHSMVDSK